MSISIELLLTYSITTGNGVSSGPNNDPLVSLFKRAIEAIQQKINVFINFCYSLSDATASSKINAEFQTTLTKAHSPCVTGSSDGDPFSEGQHHNNSRKSQDNIQRPERYARAPSRPFRGRLAELSVSSGAEERPSLTVEEFSPFKGGVLHSQLVAESSRKSIDVDTQNCAEKSFDGDCCAGNCAEKSFDGDCCAGNCAGESSDEGSCAGNCAESSFDEEEFPSRTDHNLIVEGYLLKLTNILTDLSLEQRKSQTGVLYDVAKHKNLHGRLQALVDEALNSNDFANLAIEEFKDKLGAFSREYQPEKKQ